MKKAVINVLLSIFFVGISLNLNAQEIQLLSGENGVAVLQNNSEYLEILNHVYSFEARIDEIQAENYTGISVPGYAFSNTIGYPKIPVNRQLIEMPLKAEYKLEILKFDIKEYSLKDFGINYPLVPVQHPVSKNPNIPVSFQKDEEVYSRDAYIESDLVTIDELGMMRGIRIARINISPFQYNPVSNTIRVYHDLRFKVIFSGSDITATIQQKEANASPYFNTVSKQILNYKTSEQVKGSGSDKPVKYVIVADTMFRNVLQPFVKWKVKKGFNVIEAYTDNPAVGNTTTSIRNYLKNLYLSATRSDPAPSFVLFVGDVDQIPAFSGTIGAYVTDFPYCEYTNDMFPEVFYGRFSANTVNELLPQIEKALEYEQYLMPDPSFLDKSILIAGVDYTYAPVYGNGQVQYASDNYFNSGNGIISSNYFHPTSGSQYQQIQQEIYQGAGYVNYTAHGVSSGWQDPAFMTSHIPLMQNQGKYPLMVGNACVTSSYQVYSCFAEELLRAPNKGAIGYIGASGDSYWEEDFSWSVGIGIVGVNATYSNTSLGMYDRLFHTHGELYGEWFVTQGQMIYGGNLAVAQSGSILAGYYWEIYNLMGDPSLMIYFSVPEKLSVTHLPYIPTGLTCFSLTTEPYAYAAISMNGVLHGAAFADVNGIVNIPITPFTSNGSATLVVTRQNRQPYMKDLPVISSSSPIVLLQNYFLSDSSGNNNGKVDYGENININISLKNFGLETDSTVYAKVSCSSNYVNIIDSIAYIGIVQAGDSVTKNHAFTFAVNSFIPDQEVVPFYLSILDSSGNQWNSAFSVTLNAPILKIGKLSIKDNIGGNGDGKLDPGETVDIIIEAHNQGNAVALPVIANLSLNNPLVSINKSSHQIDTLEAKQFSEAQFNITISQTISVPLFLELSLDLSNGNYSDQKSVIYTIGFFGEDFETGNLKKYSWNTGGDKSWKITTKQPYEGNYCVKSDSILDSQNAWFAISLEVLTDDSISFFTKVSSEKDYDFLSFYIDAIMVGQWSDSIPWSRKSFPLSAGQHTLKWVYEKDVNISEGSDCAWIDNIVFPPAIILSSHAETPDNKDHLIHIYPNPAKETLFIEFEKNVEDAYNIEIRNITGQLMFRTNELEKTNFSRIQVDCSGWASGIYIYTIKTEISSEIKAGKIVVVK